MTDRNRHMDRDAAPGRPDEDQGRAGGGAPDKEQADENLAVITGEIHEQVQKERDEYLESLRRLQAEFENFRKRVVNESEQASQKASSDVMEDLLPVLDNFERALKSATEHDEQVLGEGVEMVYNQLRDVLIKRGLCEVEAEGADFDPNHHEAVVCRPYPGEKAGKVMEVLEKGYRMDDKVVRPAKVIVSDEEEGSG